MKGQTEMGQFPVHAYKRLPESPGRFQASGKKAQERSDFLAPRRRRAL